jgi:hypothetical protein
VCLALAAFALGASQVWAHNPAGPALGPAPAPTGGRPAAPGTYVGDYTVVTSTGTLVPGATDIGNHGDDTVTEITLPFPVTFYDRTFVTATVSSNGNLQFVSSNNEWQNGPLPDGALNYAMLPHWGDLTTDNAGNCTTCGVFTSVTGAAPNRVFNIEWRANYLEGGPLNFEIRLFEGSMHFEFVYGAISAPPPPGSSPSRKKAAAQGRPAAAGGDYATIGVQQGANGRVTQYAYNQPGSIYDNLVLSFDFVPVLDPCLDYQVSTGSGQLVPGVDDIGNHGDDVTTTITLPFAYTLYDQAFTTVTAGSNGALEFVSSDNSPDNIVLPTAKFNYAILPYWDNLDTWGGGDCPECGIFTSVTGTAPNRVFNVEWRVIDPAFNHYNFEVRLFENQTMFQVVYGSLPSPPPPPPPLADTNRPFGPAGDSATIGVQKDTGSRYTLYAYNEPGSVDDNMVLTFTLGCVPTATPTSPPAATATATSVPPSTTTATPVPPTATVPPAATGTPCSITFRDVPAEDWSNGYIRWAYCAGIVNGYADNTFRPNAETTRGQIAKMVVLAAGWPLVIAPGAPHFSDVPPAHPFYTYIEVARAHGAISGYDDGTFRPWNVVTRAQLVKILVLMRGYPILTPATPTFTDVGPDYWAYGYIETAYHHALVGGYDCGPVVPTPPIDPNACREFRPDRPATRAQLSKILFQAYVVPSNKIEP